MSFRLQDFLKQQKDSANKTPKAAVSQKNLKITTKPNINASSKTKARKKSSKIIEISPTDRAQEENENKKVSNLPCIIEENSIESNRKDSEDVVKQILISGHFGKNQNSRRNSHKEILSSNLKVFIIFFVILKQSHLNLFFILFEEN